jgi:hypothetical protein
LEKAVDGAECSKWWERNAQQITRLRALAPHLKTRGGEHYADVLERLFRGRRTAPAVPENPRALTSAKPSEPIPAYPLALSRIALGSRIDKAALSIGTVRRLRDKTHINYVASLSEQISYHPPR